MVKARCPLHVNVTSALLDTLSDIQQQVTQLFVIVDSEFLKQRVSEMRMAQTAPGSNDLEASQTSRSGPRPPDGGRAPSASSWPGSGSGSATSGGDYNQVSRYRHRDVIEYSEMFDLTSHSHAPAGEAGAGPGWRFEGGVRLAGDTAGDGDGSKGRDRPGVSEAVASLGTPRFPVCHQFAAPVPLDSRMSFTILNLTGQRVRYFQPGVGDETRYLRYLRVRLLGVSHAGFQTVLGFSARPNRGALH